MAGIRKDVATLGAGWNPTLEWYARAIAAMSQRAVRDRTSWRYFGAIHGFDGPGWIQSGIMTAAEPLPAQAEQDTSWDQCQHSGWYFLPWHRGYLAAFEAVVAKTISDLGGPSDWALPYWNYFDTANAQARRIPQAFLDPTMPNGMPNPLAAPPRGGTVLGPTPSVPRDITLRAMTEKRFTAAPGARGFGGGTTGFIQFGSQAGAVEQDPHNLVHVMVGGPNGFMSDPAYAALDPIFWLHHCNIDRLWAAWLTQAGNIQENGPAWTNGPFPRRFEMPDTAGQLVIFTPGQTLPGGPLAPNYDDLGIGTGVTAGPAVVAGLPQGTTMPASTSAAPPPAAKLIGSNTGAVTIAAAAATTRVQIAPAETNVAASAVPQRIFLNLENVRGAAPSGVLNVYIGLPAAGTVPASAPRYADTVALFGLAKASAPDSSHGGNGLSFAIDITELAKSLAIEGQSSLEQLEVRIEQPGASVSGPITVERVSVFSQPLE